jgi:retinol dehydrogenase-12
MSQVMEGKHVVITGPTAGIGRASALVLAAQGAQLTLLCRNLEKGREVAGEIVSAGGLTPNVILMDMSRLESVRSAASSVLELNRPIDVLLNNAGLMNSHRRETVDGYEETLAVNHFAPFLLTGLLLPAIKLAGSGARIVNVASGAHKFVKGMQFDDFQSENDFSMFNVYGRSKLANMLFTRSLAKRLEADGITVNCLHPGAVSTSIGKQHGERLATILHAILKPFFRDPLKGAATSLFLCTSEEVANISGAYFDNCKKVDPKPWAENDSEAERLWGLSEKCVGFKYP